MAKRRETNVFSLSFLDVMSCGFGAVVLIFLIINHDTEQDKQVHNDELLAELRMLDYQVQQGEKDKFELLELMDDIEKRVDESDQRLSSTEETIEKEITDLDELKENSIAQVESLKALSADIETREEEVNRLLAIEASNDGSQVRSFEGEGDRQYLTGLRVGGKNIVIALDTSASMLDDTIVNVLRRRNMTDERKRAAPKWQRAVRTVEWLAAQLPLDARFRSTASARTTLVVCPESRWTGCRWTTAATGENHSHGAQKLPRRGHQPGKPDADVRDLQPDSRTTCT